jgi:hypothetical protein
MVGPPTIPCSRVERTFMGATLFDIRTKKQTGKKKKKMLGKDMAAGR